MDIYLIDEWKNCGKCAQCVRGGVKTTAQPHGPYWRALVYLGSDPPPKETLLAAFDGQARSVYYRRRQGGYVTAVIYFGRKRPPRTEALVRRVVKRVLKEFAQQSSA